MLYFIVRPIATLTLKVFFRKIYIGNADNIPLDKPVIFVCNHPTAFLEPCLLACILPRPLHFMVRGNLFKNKYINQILFSLHLIPIYRVNDPIEKRRSNKNVLATCFRYLQQNKAILIMGEGHTNVAKRLRPLKKGPARLAFGGIDFDPDLDLVVVPIGANFTKSDGFRSEVYFSCGKPIHMNDYKSLYATDKFKAMRQFTQDVGVELEKHVIDIKDPADDIFCEQAFELYRNNNVMKAWPILNFGLDRFTHQKQINRKINILATNKKQILKDKFLAYFNELVKNGLSDDGFTRDFSLLKFFMLSPGCIIFLIGFLFNWLPFYLTYFMTKNKVKSAEYKGPMKVALGMVAYLCYFLILLCAFAMSPFPWWLTFLIPVSGYLAILWWESFTRNQKAFKASRIHADVRKKRAELSDLVSQWAKSDL